MRMGWRLKGFYDRTKGNDGLETLKMLWRVWCIKKVRKIDGSRGEEGGVDVGDGVVECGMGEDGGVGGGDGFVVSGMDVESVGSKDSRGDMAGIVGWDDVKETRGDSKEV
ncbi:unnamed protein product [Prunus armeniaca]|uniref:Uncharacterized protein n=1 Tax=Prunus armeniaca TaxID=36596 RepID=A0A6J5VUL7_PRUAR|nr:unnamed protein product [Prunus armeniaca]CAB4319963.1 unnamed protein product [Prunus armeniaca]